MKLSIKEGSLFGTLTCLSRFHRFGHHAYLSPMPGMGECFPFSDRIFHIALCLNSDRYSMHPMLYSKAILFSQ